MRPTAARQQIVRRFAAARATAPDTAIAFDPDGDAALAEMTARLVRHRALVAVAPGVYYLDASRLARFRTAIRRRAAVVAAGWGFVATALATMAAFAVAE